MSDRKVDIIKQIEDIEQQLKKLRIELGREKSFKRTGQYEIGEEVVILNPKAGQGKSGKLLKVNQITRYVTIELPTPEDTRRK